MKKTIATLCLLLATIITYAQTLKEVEKADALTWYGIDFTQARFQNFGVYMNDGTVKKNLPLWSMTPFGGDDINRFKKKYDKDKLVIENKQAATRNNAADYGKQLSADPYELTEEQLKTVVAEYDIKGEGYGLLFIVEAFQYTGKKGTVWYVYINKVDKSIITSKKVSTDTFGDWFEAINNTIKQSAKY